MKPINTVLFLIALALGAAVIYARSPSRAESCLNLLRPQLKDPDSAIVVKESYNGYREWTVVEYRARNSYGGMQPGFVKCTVKGGSISGAKHYDTWAEAESVR